MKYMAGTAVKIASPVSSTSAAIQVTEFVRALALGWKNLAAYPSGHPALVTSLDQVNRRLAELRGPAGDVSFGIAADGLIYGDVKIDSPAASKFAYALYTRGVAILRFANETTSRDMEVFLRVLGAGTGGDQKRALWEDLTAAGVVNINLQPVSYSAIELTDDLAEKKPEQRDVPLFEEIVRALLQGRRFSAATEEVPRIDSADELARLIAEYAAASDARPKFDPDATFGIRLAGAMEPFQTFLAETVGRHISSLTGQKRQHSIEQAVQLIRSLPDPLRRTVLRSVAGALAADETAGTLLRDFASELPNDEVLEALRYLSSMGPLSAHAMSLLQALTTVETSSRAQPPSPGVISDLVSLFGQDDIDRFNPADHQALLAMVAIRIPSIPPEAMSSIEKLGNRVDTVIDREVIRQFSQVLLELLASLGSSRAPAALLGRLESIFRDQLRAAEFDDSSELLERIEKIQKTTSSQSLRDGIQESLARLAAGDTVQALIDLIQNSPPEKTPAIQRLTDMLGTAARRNLLLALCEENNRLRRRRLFDFISALGPSIVPDVIVFLGDSRWYVVRNMVALLRGVQDRSALPEIRKLTRHSDARVKVEAIKTLFVLDRSVPASFLEALINDPDPKLAETAVTLVGSYGMTEGVEPLLGLLTRNELFGSRRTLRIRAIRALGDLADPRALGSLDRFFSGSLLPWPPREERYAAWESLGRYPEESRTPLIERGLRSRDPQVRAICKQIAEGS